MPSVPAGIMWWCRHVAVRQRLLPVGLALELRAVARDTALGIELSAECKLGRIVLT